jgi:hypothetical protein
MYWSPPDWTGGHNPKGNPMSRFSYGHTRTVSNLGLSGTSATPLDHDAVRRACPSIFAEAAHEDRSKRYAYVPTGTIVKNLDREFGFKMVFACEATTRLADKVGFTKHMVRLRQENAPVVAGSTAEIILINSHDGSSAYIFRAGAFSFVCANGLICGKTFEAVRLRHSGNAAREALAKADACAAYFPFVYQNIEVMKEVRLGRDGQEHFANMALLAKFNPTLERDEHTGKLLPAPLTAPQVLGARRIEERPDVDGSRDLYTTFNVVQEHLVRGGDRYVTRNEERGTRRNMTTQPIRSVDRNVGVNSALWDAALEMGGLMGAKFKAPEKIAA